ncbi:MAG TPA: acetyl-CoA C-acyltransferase [Holophagaceae bacterium]|jgi:acetyl-CoA acetyltransferase family protein|nr:acetyl-CoA C-acyltransferase [Holophagaceae bacterium]
MNGALSQRVAIVAGLRTPFVKAGTVFREKSALDLAAHAVRGLVASRTLDWSALDALVFGNVVSDPRLPHFAREVAFQAGLDTRIRALTVSDNCITSLSGMGLVYDAIQDGRMSFAMVGGSESMSNPALLFSRRASRIFLDAGMAKSAWRRLRAFLRLRPRDFRPTTPGVVEPSTGLSMGEHCELMVKTWKVGRAEQDALALRSHQNAAAATRDGRLKAEIHPLDGIDHDLIVREDTSMERLGKLPPVFDRSASGTLTAGNSSPLTDGAAAVVLMSGERARQEGLKPLAYLRDHIEVAIDPSDGLLMGPGITVPRLLRRNGLSLSDIDLVEMHEAFAGQVLCNLKAWEQGWKEPAIGTMEPTSLNPLGSSIAIGHPFAATGARIVTTLANEMARRGSRHGLVSVCAAGAQAGALLLEGA